MQNLDSVFAGAENSAPNPFLDDVFAPGATDLPGVADIHGDVLAHCVKVFETLLRGSSPANAPWGSSGRTLLIAAPRAGYGKSHLVGRIRSVTESLITAVSLPFDPVRPISWNPFLDSLMNQYRSTRCPQNLSCTLFDETARFFQSNCVRLAMEYGAIAEKEVPETEVAMRVQFRDVFDPQAGSRLTTWYAKRAPEMIDAASGALCKRWSLAFDDLVFWNRFFQEHAHPKADPFSQMKDLADAEARQRLTEFLRIATDCRPAAFVADHLDGFFGSETAGMQITGILTTLRDAVPRSVTLLCLNEDLWQSVFEERIPTAWTDRLTADTVPLKGISVASAEALLRARLHAAGITGPGAAGFVSCFREKQGWDRARPDSPIYPRELIRQAAELWQRAPGESAAVAPAQAKTGSVGKGEPASPVPVPPPPAPPARHSHVRPGERDAAAAAAAARAAGKSLSSRGGASIESIIADIRGSGARAISDSGSGFLPANRTNGSRPSSPPPTEASRTPERNPFWAKNLEKRLREIEAESLADTAPIRWEPARLAYLIGSVGERFPAVGQNELKIGDSPSGTCLCWTVRDYRILLGFEPPSNPVFWKALLQKAESMGNAETRKIAVISPPTNPFDFRALTGAGADSASALRTFDVIVTGEGDLRRLYAAERFLRETESAGQAEVAARVIARRFDSFWRRLTRPLSSIEAAG